MMHCIFLSSIFSMASPATVTLIINILLISGSISEVSSHTNNELLSSVLPFAEAEYERVANQPIPILLSPNGDPSAYPFEGAPTAERWRSSRREAWTSGFLAGTFWHLSSLSSNATLWEERAQIAQQGLLPMQTWNRSHDIGFVMFCSFANAYLRTGSLSYLSPLLTAALTLSARYSNIVGCTRSWQNRGAGSADRFVVIIDNMMNLEVLFWVANQTANSTLYDMAFSHANRTSNEHVRPDGSTWQVVAFNSTDGTAIEKYTVQGYANDSTWSRGQAWAIYGFTMAYRYTLNMRFLQTAKKTADFFLENVISEDMVPFWDFDAPYRLRYEPRDTSAAAIAASGLLELGDYLGDQYRDAGLGILKDLMKYRADGQGEYKIPAILVNGTAHYSRQHFDSALIFGDYYFLEALVRLSRFT